MTTFDTLFAARFPTITNMFGETITYTPSGGSATSIAARVYRGSLIDQSGRIVYMCSIRVRQADMPALAIGRDRVSLKWRKQDSSNTTATISNLIDQDGGCWHLGLGGSGG